MAPFTLNYIFLPQNFPELYFDPLKIAQNPFKLQKCIFNLILAKITCFPLK